METFVKLAEAEDYLTAAEHQIKSIDPSESDEVAMKRGIALLHIRQAKEEVEQLKEKEFKR